MDEVKRKFGDLCDLMEKNTKGVTIACYSIAFIGLGAAMRKVRPFSRFKKPSDVPNLFVRERRELQGFVERIEPNGALLMVKHKPLVSLLRSNTASLPVKIFGVKVSGHGLSWLQAIVAGHEVKFIPISKKQKYVECEVVLPQLRQELQNKVQMVNVGESLVGVGFGTIEPLEKPLSHKESLAYISKLKNAELQLQKKQLGLKYYIKPTKLVLQSLITMINKAVTKGKPSSTKVPKQVVA